MKRVHGNKIVIILFLALILLFIQGCDKKPNINPDNYEINSLLFFITRTEHGGETQINEFKRFDNDKETIFYYVNWRYISGENTSEREHLIVLTTSTLKSELYPLNSLNDYPPIQKVWNELKEKNDFKDFSKDEVDQFITNVKNIRENLKS